MKILGRKINITFEEVDINKIAYLPFNPRLLTSLDLDDANQENIHTRLSEKDSTDNVAKRILDHGGLLENIWILDNKKQKFPNTDGLPYVVLEGNTRANIYKRLCSKEENKWTKNDKNFTRENFRRIPCMIIHDKLQQNEIEEILEELHDREKGKNPWDLAALAKYYHLKELGGLTTKEIHIEDKKKEKGGGRKASTSKEINDLIATHRLMEENEDAETKQFQLYLQVQKSEKLRPIFRKPEKDLTKDERKIKQKIKKGISSKESDVKVIARDVQDVLSKAMMHPKLINKWAKDDNMGIRDLKDELDLKTGKSQVADSIKRHKIFWQDGSKVKQLMRLSPQQKRDVLYNMEKIKTNLNRATRMIKTSLD